MPEPDGDFTDSDNNEQMVDDAGNWQTTGLVSPIVESKNHSVKVPGYTIREISHRYKVPVDHDACVASAAPDLNFGNSVTLGVLESAGPNFVHAYIKATGINNFTSGHTLDKGFLVLKRLGAGNFGTTKMNISRVSGADWDESTITWNTRPALDAATETEVSMRTLPNITDNTIAFINSNPDTITDSNGKFLDRRFINNEQINIINSVSNNGTFTVSMAEAGLLTLFNNDALIAEAAGSTVTIIQDKWIVIEMTSWIQNWLDGTWNNYGVALTPFDIDPIKLFRSSEDQTGLSFITASTIAFVDSNPDTITDSNNGFLSAGFQPGTITVTGSVSNDGSYTIAPGGVTAGTLTLIGGDTLTVEAAGALVTITQQQTISDRVRPFFLLFYFPY